MLRVLGALIVAAIVGFTLGMLKDYFKLFPPEQYEYVWPFMCAFTAVAGAAVMANMKPTRLGGLAAPAQAPARRAEPASGKALTPATGTSSDVPGMPTFDFDHSRAAADAMSAAEQQQAPPPTLAPQDGEQR